MACFVRFLVGTSIHHGANYMCDTPDAVKVCSAWLIGSHCAHLGGSAMHPSSCHMSHRCNAQLIGHVASLPPHGAPPRAIPCIIFSREQRERIPVHCHLTGTVQSHLHVARIYCMSACMLCLRAALPHCHTIAQQLPAPCMAWCMSGLQCHGTVPQLHGEIAAEVPRF